MDRLTLNHAAVSEELLLVLHKLMDDPLLKDFYLVGGTALALQIGHRVSIDIDLFTSSDFSAENLSSQLMNSYSMQNIAHEPNTIHSNINEVKIDLLAHKYPVLEDIVEIEGIRMLSLVDISAMKLNAIAGRGSKKDFWDLAFLLDCFSLKEMLSFFSRKYSNANLWHLEKSLTFFDDADEELIELNVVKMITWQEVKAKIKAEVRKFL